MPVKPEVLEKDRNSMAQVRAPSISKIVWGISDLHNGIPEIFGNFFLRNRCGNNGIQLTAVHVCISLLTALIKLDLAFHIVFLTPLLKKIYLHTAFIDSHSGILKRRKIG